MSRGVVMLEARLGEQGVVCMESCPSQSHVPVALRAAVCIPPANPSRR